MSIILGIKTNEQIIIASDKRIVSGNGSCSDNNSKLIIVNKHLAFTGAGKEIFITKTYSILETVGNRQDMIIEELFNITNEAYNLTKATCFLKKLTDKNFIDDSNTCCCFIAGKSKSNEEKLIFAYDEENKGSLAYTELPINGGLPYMIAPPEDMTSNECFHIFERNLREHPSDFMEKTIKQIASKSEKISSTGDKWIYDIKAGKGKLIKF